jgi:hypothetical protein
MSQATVNLQPIQVSLDDLYLDPNNPRFAKSLNLDASVPDEKVAAAQEDVRKLFVVGNSERKAGEDGSEETEEDTFNIADLVNSMEEIGFIPIDQIVVRKLSNAPDKYLVVEGNRRVCSAKYILSKPLPTEPNALKVRQAVLATLSSIDALLLVTEGLSETVIHDQIGVVLGLRHFGAVLPWGVLAKAVNIYNEYKLISPSQETFAVEGWRLAQLMARLSQSRSDLTNALKTYIVYLQLQDAFPTTPPRPTHYSLLQACVLNRKLQGAGFIVQDGGTYKIDEASLERLYLVCEFGIRDRLADDQKILRDPKTVNKLAGLVHTAAGHEDSAVRAFASSLRDEVYHKDRSLEDATNHLKSFMSDRIWTEALDKLLAKVTAPSGSKFPTPDDEVERLNIDDFHPIGNDQLHLEEADKAFKNLRRILGL